MIYSLHSARLETLSGVGHYAADEGAELVDLPLPISAHRRNRRNCRTKGAM